MHMIVSSHFDNPQIERMETPIVIAKSRRARTQPQILALTTYVLFGGGGGGGGGGGTRMAIAKPKHMAIVS